MARKSGKKKAKRLPVNRFLYFSFKIGDSKKYIDLAAAISAMNGRLYRQGRMYHVANVTMHNTDGKIKSCKLSTLPDTYTTQAAWHAMFDAWKDQRARVLENSIGDITGKWSDFKVVFNKDMKNNSWMMPTDSDNASIRGGTIAPSGSDTSESEWQYSTVNYTDKDGTYQTGDLMGMLGETSIAGEYISIINELFNARAAVMVEDPDVDPNVLKQSVIFNMNPANAELGQNSNLLQRIAEDNDIPPYNNQFPIGYNNPPSSIQGFPVREMGITSTSVLTQTVGGFPVPLGLLEVEGITTDGLGNPIGLIIELVPGRYKGIASEAF
jgi:hypothetical protein